MIFNVDLSHVLSGFVGALVLYLILCYYGDDEEEEKEKSKVRNDSDEPYLEIEDLLDEDSPLTEDPVVEGNYLWWGEPYIGDDQKVLGLLYEAITMIHAQGMVIEMLQGANSAGVPLPPFPVLDDVVTEPVVPVAEVTETTHEAAAPNWNLVENKSEAEVKLAPKDTGRPLSSPYDAWMFPKRD